MKIDYITNLRLPSEKANSIQIMQNCEAFKKAGAKVSLYVPMRFGTKKERRIEDIWEYYQVEKRFPIKKIFCVDIFPLGLDRPAFILQSITFYLAVAVLFLFKKNDVIYTRDVWLALALFYKKKKVLELHNYPVSKLGRAIYGFLSKLFWKVVVISDGLQKEVPESLVAPDGVKISLFEGGLSKEAARDKLKMPLHGRIVVYTGSLQKWKGVPLLLKAAKKMPETYFYIVGGSLDKKDLTGLHGGDNVTFVGHIPQREAFLYLKAADVLAIPNTGKDAISRKYTSPLKAFEYMAADKEVVVSDIPSMREIFNKKNSYLFKSGDSDDLVRAIKEAFSDGGRREDPSKYSWDARVAKIIDWVKI
ncbi:MAG: glycosyltransferase [Patescibacteria group bacterium]|nr:glycosyltransferase [Patescibacteria group bacterium]